MRSIAFCCYRPTRATLFALLALGALAGCTETMGGAPLVSAQYPPAAGGIQGGQPINSLPRGAANISSAPNATEQNALSWTFGGGNWLRGSRM